MIKHLSFSSIKQFISCPTSWASKYLDGEKDDAGFSADFGNQFEAFLASKHGYPAPKLKAETEEIVKAFEIYNPVFAEWKGNDNVIYQHEIKISPAQWAEYAEELDANPEMPYNLLGYVDFLKMGREVLDLKTRARLELKPEDVMQTLFYSIPTKSRRIRIDMYGTQTGKIRTEQRNVTKTMQRETMDTLAYYANQIKKLVENRVSTPRLPGFHCQWCPLARQMVDGHTPACALHGAIS